MKRLFVVIFIALASFCLSAQDRLWDAALDQYQQICDECILLRGRYASGENVSLASVTQLMARLSELKKTLKEAEGQMTPAQKLRFESIRLRYEEVFGKPRSNVRIPLLPALTGTADCLGLAGLIPEHYTAASSVGTMKKAVAGWEGMSRSGVLLLAGFPDMYYGAMLTLPFPGKPVGAFAKASVSVPYVKGAYDCKSDGTTVGGYIWTSGKECVSRWAVTAGAVISPLQILDVYAGAGYGRQDALWGDVSGQWARVADRSVSSVAADAGVIVYIRRVSLLAGVSTVGFGNFSAELGAGFSF